MVESASRKPCRIAEEEIRAGKVQWVLKDGKSAAAARANELLDKAIGS